MKRIFTKEKKQSEAHMFSGAALRALMIPLIIEQVLNSLMGTVDTVMVSNVGPAAMSAVSLVDSINMLFIQVFSALATGGCIICSQYIGKRNEKGANKSAGQVLFATFWISIAITLVCLIFNRRLLQLVFGQVEADVMEAAVTYFFYTALSFPFLAVFSAGSAIYRAQGNSGRPMLISVISNFINIGGNAFLIWGLHMGVSGVAIATLLSRAFCAVVVMGYLRRPGQQIVVREYLSIRPDRYLILKVLAIGIPSGVENGMFQFGKLAIQSTVSTMGTVAIAAQAMTNIMENLNGMAAQGIGIGLMTVVGQCIGAGKKEEAVYYIKKMVVVSEICMIFNCLLVYALAGPITVIGAMEPESAALCLSMMGVITLVKPVVWIGSFIPAFGMRAAGDVKYSMIVSTVSMWLSRVSLCIFLVRVFGMGPMAVWIGMFTDWTVRGLFFGVRFHSRKWLSYKAVE